MQKNELARPPSTHPKENVTLEFFGLICVFLFAQCAWAFIPPSKSEDKRFFVVEESLIISYFWDIHLPADNTCDD